MKVDEEHGPAWPAWSGADKCLDRWLPVRGLT